MWKTMVFTNKGKEPAKPGTYVHRQWKRLETMGRTMFLLSVVFFVVGVTITVFGYSGKYHAGIDLAPMQVLGPVCLASTVVLWLAGCIMSQIWNKEWKRRQLQMNARDSIRRRISQPPDPINSPDYQEEIRARRQILQRMREQVAVEYSSERGSIFGGSHAGSRSRRSSSKVFLEEYSNPFGSRPRGLSMIAQRVSLDNTKEGTVLYQLPGIEISRADTIDDRRASLPPGMARHSLTLLYGAHLMGAPYLTENELLPYSSEYSLSIATSRSTRTGSRSSRASTFLSSRFGDFSGRESDFDADVSVQSRDSISYTRREGLSGMDEEASDILSIGRKSIGTISFDSRKLSAMSAWSATEIQDARKLSAFSAWSGTDVPDSRKLSAFSAWSAGSDMTVDARGVRMINLAGDSGYPAYDIPPRMPRVIDGAGSPPQTRSSERRMSRSMRTWSIQEEPEPNKEESPPSERRRPPLKRNNTDDSEVERKVAKLMHQIQYSTTDSVDDSKIQSSGFSSDFEYTTRKTQGREIQTQTSFEYESVPFLLDARTASSPTGDDGRVGTCREEGATGRSELEPAGRSGLSPAKSETHTRSIDRLRTLISSIAAFSRRTTSGKKKGPRHISLNKFDLEHDIELGLIRSPPPSYEQAVKSGVAQTSGGKGSH